jgi:(p)ppGpp synthase/HD superfamily hydrolase
MNLSNIELANKYEQALKLLCAHAKERPGKQKNLLLHAVRVSQHLYQKEYSVDIVIAGLLHDIIEWTDIEEEVVEGVFGTHILEIILATTKDRSIEDPILRREEMVARCVKTGKEALIVKAADTLDSYQFYTAVGDKKEIDRAVTIVKLLVDYLPEGMVDPIFDKLRAIA